MNLTSEHKKELTRALLLLGLDERIIRELFASFQFPMIEEEVKITIANLKTERPTSIDLTFHKPQGAQMYTLPEYTGTLVLQPKIEHLDINGINTLQLEQLMSTLDWNYDYRQLEFLSKPISKQDWAVYENYIRALSNLVMLSVSDQGMQISNDLRIKYLLNTPYEDRYVNPDLKRQYVRSETFFANDAGAMTITEADNFLHGRSVRKSFQMGEGQEIRWFSHSPDEPCGHGFFATNEWAYPDYNLLEKLSHLPLAYRDKEDMDALMSLMGMGEIVPVALLIRGNLTQYYVQATPENAGFRLFDRQMKEANTATLKASEKKGQTTVKMRMQTGIKKKR